MKKLATRIFILLITSILIQQLMQHETKACNVAVVSASASATGRPFIWKNRDHTESYRHQVLYFPEEKAGIGGSMRLMGETFFNGTADPTTVCTGGTNESGFAITNTTCIDIDHDLFDASNVNTNLMEKALAECRYLSEFETLALNYRSYWKGKNISGIFAVIDAHGGAAIYEMYTDGNGNPLMFRKFDVVNNTVTDENGAAFTDYKYPQTTGFNNRTNSNHTRGWIDIASDTPRELRARQLLSAMKLNNTLTPRNLMRYVSKDVCGGTPADYFYDPADPAQVITNVWDNSNSDNDTYLTPNRDGEMFTGYCISRFQTTMGLVIEGAATPDQVNTVTMWVSLGEPSLSVFIPFFPYAEHVSPYATDNAHDNSGYYWDGVSATSSTKPTCFLNLLFDCVEANPFSMTYYPSLNNIYKNIDLYTNNGSGNYLDYGYRNNGGAYPGLIGFYKMDNTIDYPRLLSLQAWTLPLEDQVFNHTDEFLKLLRSDTSLVSRDELAKFSNYVCSYVYNNYSNQSASYAAWSYTLPDNGVAPKVISIDPANGAVNPPVTNKITVRFSEAVDASTVNANTFKLLNGTAGVDGTVVYDSLTHSAAFSPDGALATNSTYTIVVTTGVKDLTGLNMAAQYTSTFTLTSGSDPDSTVPVINAVNTGNGGSVFPVDGSIVVQFSEAMDPDTINVNTFIVTVNSNVVQGTVEYNSATNSAIFTPDSPLSGNTTYTVDLTTGIRDQSGNSIADDYTWSFTTGTAGSNPSVNSVSPADLSVQVDTGTLIYAQFDKLMDETSINSGSFRVTAGSSSVNGTVTYDTVNRTALFTPAGKLDYNTTYTAELTADIKDNQGRYLTDTKWSFTTGSTSSGGSGGSDGGGCGTSAIAATAGTGTQPLLPGLLSLAGMMIFPFSLIYFHRRGRRRLSDNN